LKNVQIRDGTDNATLSIFRATESEFSYLFPNPGQDIELVDDFIARHHEKNAAEILDNLWLRPTHKADAAGIHGTLYYNYADKRHHLPASKREIDRDPSQINRAERELYARIRAEEAVESDTPFPVTTAELLTEIPGGAQLVEWFDGRVPSFHDAEVLGLTLDRRGARCTIGIHTFQMTSEVDAKGFFVFDKHAQVSFHLEGVTKLELNDFNEQNVIYGLALSRAADQAIRLELDQCHGLFSFVEARALKIELQPGKPSEGVYG
jgi:hypothetical protein